MRHEAGDCREPPLPPQEGSSSAVRRKKLTEAKMKSNKFLLELKCLVSVALVHLCSSGYASFDCSLTVMGATSEARPAVNILVVSQQFSSSVK